MARGFVGCATWCAAAACAAQFVADPASSTWSTSITCVEPAYAELLRDPVMPQDGRASSSPIFRAWCQGPTAGVPSAGSAFEDVEQRRAAWPVSCCNTAERDPLTNLYNRRWRFHEELARMLADTPPGVRGPSWRST